MPRAVQKALFGKAAPARVLEAHICHEPGCGLEGGFGEGYPITPKGSERWWCRTHVPPGFLPRKPFAP